MGIYINGEVDNITSTDGSLTITGASLINAGTLNVTGVSTFSDDVFVGAGKSITVGNSFIRNNAVGIGTTTTTGRNAGVGTAGGSLIYNVTDDAMQLYVVNSNFSNAGYWINLPLT